MKKRILLTSHTEDNIKALYDYYKKHIENSRKDIVVEYRSYYKYKDNKVLHYVIKIAELLKSYSIVVSDYTTKTFSKAENRIFMSHGYGTKKTPGNNELNNEKVMNVYKDIVTKIKNVVTLSERDSTYFLKSEKLDKLPSPNYIPLGLPRNDLLFDKEFIEKCRKEFDIKYGTKGKKILLFCPTWRGYKIENKFPIINEQWMKLDKFMGENNWKMIYRPHYLERLLDDKDFSEMENIVTIDFDKELSTQKLLTITDMLMTDYSSIYVDYLALNRPIAFLPYDREQYDKERGLAIDFDNNLDTPGPKLKNVDDLIDYMKDVESHDSYKNFRDLSRKQFYKYLDGDSCKRVWNLILQFIDEK